MPKSVLDTLYSVKKCILDSLSVLFRGIGEQRAREECDVLSGNVAESARACRYYPLNPLGGNGLSERLRDRFILRLSKVLSNVRVVWSLSPALRVLAQVKLAMSHVVPDLVQKVIKGQDPLHILGSGMQRRHYTCAQVRTVHHLAVRVKAGWRGNA